MGMSGYALSELVMGFKPAGLEFDRPATLALTIGRDLVDVDLDDLTVYHFTAQGGDDDGDDEDDGSDPEEATLISVTEMADAVRIRVEIRSFSRYSLSPGCCSWDDGF